ncbi:hypothetical protein M747DRAFT_125715 [Aspergillus niger ATCC 13496]|uniref:Uncharacterized protein n=1 Tax=Aspergillus niger ATCC 13496 TaxID=1353008 RepID=A0A370BKC1_ASPNG|nr:hypothetical protein M747DRAFT_125715 [Aspergillus niger ATCC 13496]
MGAIGSIKRLHQLSEREPKPAGCPVPSLLPLRSMLAFLPFPFYSEFFFSFHALLANWPGSYLWETEKLYHNGKDEDAGVVVMMGAHFHLISSHRGKSFYINGLLVETHVTNFAGMMMDMSDWRPIRQKFILTICYHASVSLCFFLSFFLLLLFHSSLCISSDMHSCVCRLFPSGVMIAPAAVCLFV